MRDGKDSIGLMVSGAWFSYCLPLTTSCLTFPVSSIATLAPFHLTREQFLLFHFPLLGLLTGTGSLMQKGRLATGCDPDPLARAYWSILDSG